MHSFRQGIARKAWHSGIALWSLGKGVGWSASRAYAHVLLCSAGTSDANQDKPEQKRLLEQDITGKGVTAESESAAEDAATEVVAQAEV